MKIFFPFMAISSCCEPTDVDWIVLASTVAYVLLVAVALLVELAR
jgi:hypothetical protein